MAAANEQELRDRLDEVTDEDVLEQRRRLEEGEAQPTPVIVDARPVIADVVEIAVGESLEVSLDFEPVELASARSDADRTLLVIGQRGLTDNLFSVVIELGGSDGFGEPIPEVGERLRARDERRQEGPSVVLKELFFFDHVEGEQHRPGDVVESVSPIGHYTIDIGDQIALFEEFGVERPALRFTVLALHEEAEPTVPFLIGEVSVANVRFESG